MGKYIDKFQLYSFINTFRNNHNIKLSDYPIDTLKLCSNLGKINIEQADFSTPGLRGMAIKSTTLQHGDIIILNKNRTTDERNFDCGHELFHLIKHRNLETQTFHCFERTMPTQDPFIEWQANEGSAELIMPYKAFIPDIQNAIFKLKRIYGIDDFECHLQLQYALAEKYNVTPQMASYRLENLRYEAYQYYEGTALDSIEILSNTQQQKRAINISILDLINSLYISA